MTQEEDRAYRDNPPFAMRRTVPVDITTNTNRKRLWITQETAEALNTPADNGCVHPHSSQRYAYGRKARSAIMCLGCGTTFDVLGWCPADITDETEALEFYREYREGKH